MWDKQTTDFTGGSFSRVINFYDSDDVEYSLDIVGKFSKHRLIDQDVVDSFYHIQSSTYNHSLQYNQEDDYASFKNEGKFLRYELRYDDNCNLLEFKKMDRESELERKYTFQYDEKHNLIGCTIYQGNHLLLKQVKYNYDENNSVIAYIIYDAKRQVTNSFSFTYEAYDTNGNWQKRTKYKNNKLLAITIRRIQYF